MIVIYEFLFILKLIPIAIFGWFRSLLFSLVNLISFWSRKTILEQITIVFLFIQVILSTQPWVSYEIQFFKKEINDVSIKINLWIILFAGFLFLLHFIWKKPIHRYLFLIGQVSLGLILLLGYLMPNPIFVDFLVREEFFFNLNFYIFLSIYSITTVLSLLKFLSAPEISEEIDLKEIPDFTGENKVNISQGPS